MKIRDIMSSPVYVVEPEETVARARNLMLRHHIGRLVIMGQDNLVGIVTKKDLGHRLKQAEPQWRRRPIDHIPINIVMTPDPITIFPEATPGQAAEIMLENDVSGLPVVGRNGLVGIITKWDLIRYFSSLGLPLKVSDLPLEPVVTVHRHHTIHHIIFELRRQEADRAVVVEGNDMPVGIITFSNLAFTELRNQTGALPGKDVKLARKSTAAGQKQYRSVWDVPLVAEDIMSHPLITIQEGEPATRAARVMVEERINGLPAVTADSRLLGMITGDIIIRELLEVK